ncbi:MAG: hypothetical protein O2913_10265 [Chloroflexi bacterium]|nr:hypothetical protein [Chloroflexota bacterium]
MHIAIVDSKTAAVSLLGSLHLVFSALLISNLIRGDYGGFAVSMALVLTLTVIGALSLLFLARARITGSAVSARYAMRLTKVFACLAVASVLVSWTYIVGFAIASVAYLIISLLALAFASQTARDLRNRS